MGDVHRTDALWNKLACPREPTGSLSEAIYKNNIKFHGGAVCGTVGQAS